MTAPYEDYRTLPVGYVPGTPIAYGHFTGGSALYASEARLNVARATMLTAAMVFGAGIVGGLLSMASGTLDHAFALATVASLGFAASVLGLLATDVVHLRAKRLLEEWVADTPRARRAAEELNASRSGIECAVSQDLAAEAILEMLCYDDVVVTNDELVNAFTLWAAERRRESEARQRQSNEDFLRRLDQDTDRFLGRHGL